MKNLTTWLGNVPEYSVYFCRGLLIATLVDQLTVGLGAANQAIGKIRSYSLAINTIKFLTIPVMVGMLYFRKDPGLIMTLYVIFEFVCALMRLYFLKRTAGLSIESFVRNVFLKEGLALSILFLYCAVIVALFDFEYRFVLTLLTAPFLYAVAIYFVGLCPDEKAILSSLLSKLDRRVDYCWRAFLGRYFPERLAKRLYYKTLGRKLDIDDPKDLNEKINWLKFHSDISSWSLLADKYKVREYVTSKGYGQTLVKLYGVWSDVGSIDWDVLPEKFVLKTNNGSGDVILCDSISSFDKASAVSRISAFLERRFGIMTAEPHYLAICPRIMAEELLDARMQAVESSSLVDYKIWCINGRPEYIWVVANRSADGMDVLLYDLEWRPHPEYSVSSRHYRLMENGIPCPANIGFMLKMATDLSAGYPQMRVDLYEVGGKVYFGELTLTSASGMMEYFTPEFLLMMGEKIKLQ